MNDDIVPFQNTESNVYNRVLARLSNLFEVQASGKNRILSMEGLRGFSIMLVFLVHYSLAVAPWVNPESFTFRLLRAMAGLGNAGVDLFFLISGFLIYGVLVKRSQPFPRYISRRVRRIYPVFLAVMAIYIALSAIAPSESKLPSHWSAAALLVVQSTLLLPGIVQMHPIVGVAWSLSYEMFFYLCLPLLLGIFALRTRSRTVRVLFFGGLTGVIIANAVAFGGLHVRLIMFVAGILLQETIQVFSVPKASVRVDSVAVLVVILCFVAVWLLREHRTPQGVLLAPEGTDAASEILEAIVLFIGFFALCFASFARTGWVSRIFSITPVRWIGNISYSYYLIHNLVLRIMFAGIKVIYPPSGHAAAFVWVMLPLSFAVTLVPAALLFLLVERRYSLASKRAPDTGTIERVAPQLV